MCPGGRRSGVLAMVAGPGFRGCVGLRKEEDARGGKTVELGLGILSFICF